MIHEAVYQKMRSGVDMTREGLHREKAAEAMERVYKKPAPKMEQAENPFALAALLMANAAAFTMLAAAL